MIKFVEELAGKHYGYVGEALFYTIEKQSENTYRSLGRTLPFTVTRNSLEASKVACDEDFRDFLSKAGLALKA